jgi:hypothetical protein
MDAVTATTCHLNVDPETTTICNCTDCRTMSGAPLRAIVITQPGTFVLLSGQPTEYPGKAKADQSACEDLPRDCGRATLAELLLPWLRTIGSLDLRTLDTHSSAAISEPNPIPSVSCRRCSPDAPFAKLEF